MNEFVPISLYAPGALIGFFILAVWRGWLIPRRFHEERIADKTEEAKLWRATAEENARQSKQLIESLATTNHLLSSISAVIREESGSDGKTTETNKDGG